MEWVFTARRDSAVSTSSMHSFAISRINAQETFMFTSSVECVLCNAKLIRIHTNARFIYHPRETSGFHKGTPHFYILASRKVRLLRYV